MTFTKVEKVPEQRRACKNLIRFLTQFMAENIKIAEVRFTEHDYKSAKVAQTSMIYAIKRERLPIKTVKREERLFLVRTDM